ncbi:hypothetical protein JL107_13150 [Nakamurella flavida]|uniref:histidine kinase n=1 Tax=Nakamurella flavida TaxID=363630 RepID=A0A938YQ87_9ACTN|nr:histidine kinase [Nakamurella flavida]MBM9477394.1 hypothetical protein [Nakamurella flavida]MDP9777326.1 signal transduction histidine kinase [Nakamurella flavida]
MLAALLADLPDVTSLAVAVPFLVAGVVLVLLRRVAPRAVVAAAVGLWFACGLVEPQLTLALVVLVALYTVGAAGARVVAPVAAVVVAGLVGSHLVFRPVADAALIYGLIVAVVAAATGIGLYRGSRRDLVRQWRERAQALEREQERERELAATTERLRIARDMHDVVGHHLTVMVTLAEAAVTVLPDPDSPDGAGPAMTMIATTGREALAETRRMLGVLRSPGPEVDPGDPVDDLAAPLRAAGLAVDSTGGELWARLPAELRAALHRVAQEALTNALKYAGPGAVVTVSLDRDSTGLHLIVTDDGGADTGAPRAAPVSSSGHGLTGMQERLEQWAGEVSAGPLRPRGWSVRAVVREQSAH